MGRVRKGLGRENKKVFAVRGVGEERNGCAAKESGA